MKPGHRLVGRFTDCRRHSSIVASLAQGERAGNASIPKWSNDGEKVFRRRRSSDTSPQVRRDRVIRLTGD